MQEPFFWPCACENWSRGPIFAGARDHMRATATAESPLQAERERRDDPRGGQGRGNISAAEPCVRLRCPALRVAFDDASHRGPGLGRSWERSQVHDHQRASSCSSRSLRMASCGAWERRRRPASGKRTSGLSSNATLHAMQRLAVSVPPTFERTLSVQSGTTVLQTRL
jgi:hypothetical protein